MLYRAGIMAIIFIVLSFTSPAQNTGDAGTKGMRITPLPGGQSIGNTYALIVGISLYTKLPRLKYADSDAISFRDFLITKAGGSVPYSNIRLYLNDSVTGSTIYNLGIKSWLSNKDLKKGDRIYIYLSGHGDADLGTNYFLTSQCNPAAGYQSTDALQIDAITNFIKHITPLGVQVVFIFDACRTNENRTAAGKADLNNFVQGQQVSGEILMIAAKAGETSIEDRDFGGGHGLFTYYLLLGMAGYADYSHKGKISFEELASYVKINVIAEANKRKHEQTPFFSTIDNNPELCIVDSNYFNSLVKANDLHRMMLSNEEVYAAKSGSSTKTAGNNTDSNALALYNTFSDALRSQHLLGKNSADTLYMQLEKRFPSDPLTDDARYLLANEFINYAQRKINIHINGKDISYVNNAKKMMRIDSIGENPVTKEVYELERVMKVKFGDAAKMMQRAIELLKNDTAYIKTLQTKLWFLQAKSYYDELNSSISYDSAIRLMRRAVIANPNASYCYNLLGQLYRINKDKKIQDSAELMFAKSISLSPSWVYPYRNLGGYYREKTNYDKAVENYKMAIRLDSTDAETYNEMGILYYSKKEYDQAENYYKKSLATDPGQKYASRNLGLLYSVQKQKALSEKYYLLSIQIDSNYAGSYYDLAYEYTLTGKNELAEKYYRKAIEKDPQNADYLNNLGVFYFNQGKDSLAIVYYEKATRVNPKYILANNNLGLLYKNEKKFDLSKKYYLKGIELDANNANAYNGLGLLYYYAGNHSDSAEYNFKKSVQIDSLMKYPYYNLGNLYNYEGNYPLAEKYYLKAIGIDSSYSYAYYMLASVYKKLRQTKLAEKNYLMALQFDSTNVSILNDLGVLYDDDGSLKEAEKYYKKAVEINPRYLLAYENLALFYKNHQQSQLAESCFLKILTINPADTLALNGLGSVYYLRMNKDDLAETYFKKTLQFDSSYKYAYYNLGNLYYRQKKYPLAEKNYLKAIQIDPKYTYAYYMLAVQYKFLHDNESAEKYYLKALQTDSANVDVLNDLGTLYDDLGKDELAEKHYKAAIAINPKYRLGYNNLGLLYKKEKKYDLAEKYYTEALKLDSLNSDLYNRLGMVYYEQTTKDQQAEAAFKKAIQIANKYRYPYSNLGNLYDRQQKYELAETFYLKAIQLEPDEISLYNALGFTYQSHKKFEEARKSFLHAIRIDHSYKYAYANLGDSYKSTNDFELALKYYKQAIEIDSNYKYAREQLGLLYLGELKNPEKGREVFEKLVTKYPLDSNCSYNLACAYSRLGNTDQSLYYLEAAIKNGMKDAGWMRKDSDLITLRKDPRFEELINKYLPGK